MSASPINLAATVNQDEELKKSFFWARIRRYFVAGVLITAPVSITLYLTWMFISFIDNNVESILPPQYNPDTYLPFTVPGLGLLIVFVFLTTVGALAAGIFGRIWIKMVESVMTRTPVVRSIYTALKQIFETVFSENGQSFKEAVLIEYPRRGMWVIGFLTGETKGEVQHLTNDVVLNVFVPTTPNPTSGFLVFIPKKDTHVLDMSVEDALKLVISGGIVYPKRDTKKEAPKAVEVSKAKAPSKALSKVKPKPAAKKTKKAKK